MSLFLCAQRPGVDLYSWSSPGLPVNIVHHPGLCQEGLEPPES